MVIHDTQCPYWDQVTLLTTQTKPNQTSPVVKFIDILLIECGWVQPHVLSMCLLRVKSLPNIISLTLHVQQATGLSREICLLPPPPPPPPLFPNKVLKFSSNGIQTWSQPPLCSTGNGEWQSHHHSLISTQKLTKLSTSILIKYTSIDMKHDFTK